MKHITVVVLLLEYGKMITYLDHQIWKEENTPDYLRIRCRNRYQCMKRENTPSVLSYLIFFVYKFCLILSHPHFKYLIPFDN